MENNTMKATKDKEAIFCVKSVPQLKAGETFKFTEYCWMRKSLDNKFEATVINAVGGSISETFKSRTKCVEWIKQKNETIEKLGRSIG